jgi:hypothetical protein
MLSEETENIIKSLKPTNSHGYDEISVEILKANSHIHSSPYIGNKASSTGVFLLI